MYVIFHLASSGYVREIVRDRHGYVHPLLTCIKERAKKYKTLSGATRAWRRISAVCGAGYMVVEVDDGNVQNKPEH